MVTLTKIGDEYNSQTLEITGLSTDEKPIDSVDGVAITNGSKFIEIDTGAEYLYNAESSIWIKNVASATSIGGTDGVTPLLQKSENAIQVSYDNGSTYEDLVLLSEITGSNGKDGTNGKNGVDGDDGKDGVSCTHSWSGTTLSITSASGTSSANLKGEKGDKGDAGTNGVNGAKGDQGEPGKNGASIASITLVKDAEGSIIGGTATLTDSTTIEITITTAE